MGGGSGTGGGSGMGRMGGNMGPDSRGMDGMDPRMNMPTMSTRNPGEIMSRNPRLSSKLQSLVPPGTNLSNAASGFKNMGQFVATAHVSHNLDIPFSDLKARMIAGDRLGKAIHALKPDVNAKDEEKKANRQAKDTLREMGS